MQRGEGTHGSQPSKMPLHLLSSSLLSSSMPCPPLGSQSGALGCVLNGQAYPGLRAGTGAGLREFTQTKGPQALQRTEQEPSSYR